LIWLIGVSVSQSVSQLAGCLYVSLGRWVITVWVDQTVSLWITNQPE